VTQQNSATSEETASASEELSSQAAEMQMMVENLDSIVRGAHSNDANHKAVAGDRRNNALVNGNGGKSTQGTKPVKVLQAKTEVVKPGDVIPLDDNDFDEF
jgi:methyl-accepting chemotaxis protein